MIIAILSIITIACILGSFKAIDYVIDESKAGNTKIAGIAYFVLIGFLITITVSSFTIHKLI